MKRGSAGKPSRSALRIGPRRVPLSDSLVTVTTKGKAAPAPEPGRREKPQQERVAMTFRITTDAYERLRRMAFETRQPQQALVDQALDRSLTAQGS